MKNGVAEGVASDSHDPTSTHTFCKLTLLILRKSFDIVVHECTKLELLNKNDLQKSLNPKIRCVGKLLDFKTGPDVIPKGG